MRGSILRRRVLPVAYLLRDEFLTDRAAGEVNGTPAEPGPGIRNVTDVEGNISISNSKLVIDQATGVYGETVYLQTVAREAGRIIICKVDQAAFGKTRYFGVSNNITAPYDGYCLFDMGAAGTARLYNHNYLGDHPAEQPFRAAQVLRSAGCYTFIRRNGLWRLYYVDGRGSDITVYVHLGAQGSGVADETHYDFLRLPSALYLPSPLASDGFSQAGTTDGKGHPEGVAGGLGSGGAGLSWQSGGSTWSVSGGKAVNSPNVGDEMITDGDMEQDNVDNWLDYGTPVTKEKNTTNPINGVRDLHIVTDSTFEGAKQSLTLNTGTFYRFEGKLKVVSSAFSLVLHDGAGSIVVTPAWGVSPTEPTAYKGVGLVFNGGTGTVFLSNWNSAGGEAYFDDISVKPLITNELLQGVRVSTPDVFASVEVTLDNHLLGGLALCVDDKDDPKNFVLVCLSRAVGETTDRVKVVKFVNGVPAVVSNVTKTYVPGATLKARKEGTKLWVWYNDEHVCNVTISNESIINNRLHGTFSVGNPNEVQLDNFVVCPVGSEGQYSLFDKWARD